TTAATPTGPATDRLGGTTCSRRTTLAPTGTTLPTGMTRSAGTTLLPPTGRAHRGGVLPDATHSSWNLAQIARGMSDADSASDFSIARRLIPDSADSDDFHGRGWRWRNM